MIVKMAASFISPKHSSPTQLSRTLEKVFDEAQHTGELNLSGRKLKEYPKVANKYDLGDTSSADLSKNRLADIPREVCDFRSLERLDAYHNVIRAIPHALVQLQALVHLNLSRNQLTTLPPFLSELVGLEVLHAANNKLVSLPEEIGKLERLMDLDVSCNEITHIPVQMGQLESLRSLNVRRNLLVELPIDINKLQLTKLDISSNRIAHIPCEYRHIHTLQELHLQHNPLVCPPAHICTKGLGHIMKFLHTAAAREDRRRGVIMSEVELRRHPRKSLGQQISSDEYRYLDSPDDRRKRHTVDSGYSTTDSSEKSRWSPSELDALGMGALRYTLQRLGSTSLLSVTSDLDDANVLAMKAAEVVKEQRQEREAHYKRRSSAANPEAPVPPPMAGLGPPGPGGTLSPQTPYSAAPPASSQPTPTSVASSPSPLSPLVTERSLLTQAAPGTTPDRSPLATTPSPLHHHHPHPHPAASSPYSPQQHHPHMMETSPSSVSSTPSSLGPSPAQSPLVTSSSAMGTPRSEHTTPGTPGTGGSGDGFMSQVDLVDEFTRELHRQKAEYEARKQKAARLRKEQEQEEEREREERRRAALRLQESQKKLIEDARRTPVDTASNGKLGSPTYPNNYIDQTDASPTAVNHNNRVIPTAHPYRPLGHSHSLREERSVYRQHAQRRLGHSHSFRGEEKPPYANNNNYRKTRSDSSYPDSDPSPQGPRDVGPEYAQWRNNGVHDISPNQSSSPQIEQQQQQQQQHHQQQQLQQHQQHQQQHQQHKYMNNHHHGDEEFRARHEAMLLRQRQEAARVQRCLDDENKRQQSSLEDEKQRMKQIQKEAVLSYFTKRSQLSRAGGVPDEEDFSFSRDSTPNTSFNSSTMPAGLRGKQALPVAVQRGLEEMSADLTSMNPAFTIRRQFLQAQEECEMIDNLRRNIESRLKVTLPDDLPAALKDGVVLCHLANHIRPRSVSSIHVPSPAVPKLTTAKCRRNVENFLEACRRIGVDQDQLCPASAVLEEKALVSVALTVQALLASAGAPQAPIMSTV